MKTNILILTYWSYPDALIQTYTLPYVRIIKNKLPSGSSIFLVTLEKDPKMLERSKRDEITAVLEEEGIYWLPYLYKPFGLAAFLLWTSASLKLGSLILRKEISFIHCWCTPPGAIGYFLSILTNRKLVLDSYEPHAETMVENGTWRKKSIAFWLLFWLEKKQTMRASFVISATQGMYGYALEKYGVAIPHFYVKPACVDLNLFAKEKLKDEFLLKRLGLAKKLVCVYAGKFGGIYLENEVFDFLRVAYEHWGDAFRVLLLTSHTKNEIELYCQEAGLPKEIVKISFVPHEEVPRYMGLGDFAISPVKPIPTKRYCTPIKDGEYWALGLPVVIPSNISDDSDIIETNKIGAVLYNLDTESYRNAVLKIDILLKQPRKETFAIIRSIAEQYRNFEIAEKIYGEIYLKKEDSNT